MLNKSAQFEKELQELASYAKVLSHQTRIQILQELIQKKSCTCLDIVDGSSVCYGINSKVMKKLRDGFTALFRSSFNKCC